MTDGTAPVIKSRKILLLQGPVGPFFKELQEKLREVGYSVKRVLFNFGDSLFASGQSCVRFTGTLDAWKSWLQFEILQNRPDCIVLFGSSRPAHKMARHLADQFGIQVLSLEEGYLRAGYITAEQGGNNQHSPLVAWKHDARMPSDIGKRIESKPMRSSFAVMSLWGATYYLARDLLSRRTDEELFHRPRESVLTLSWRWFAQMQRRAAAWITEIPLRRALHRNPGFILVPLQVSNDSQIQLAARGWTTCRLVNQCLMALAQTNPHQTCVFKLHPLERFNNKITRMIDQRARSLGIDQKNYKILHTGRIGDLTAHSSGMVLINSTSGFSALHHGVPLLVLGDAIYRHEEIATIGKDQKDIVDFCRLRQSKSPEAIAAFFEAVKSQSLLSGDFYVSAGRKEAIRNIVQKLNDITVAPSVAREVN
jgi:capsular polysaccharide export protein